MNELYTSVTDKVKTHITSDLKEGYGTIIFDGWGASTSASVVNVLLRTEGCSPNEGRSTYFLESAFSTDEKVGAEAYVRIVESFMEKYGGMERICGVTSDSAQCCRNAKRALTRKYHQLVGIQDQAHVANLCMQDIGDLPWIKAGLDRVEAVATVTKNKIKLRARIFEAIDAYNKTIGPQVSPPQPGTNELSPEASFPPLPRTAVTLKRPSKVRFAWI